MTFPSCCYLGAVGRFCHLKDEVGDPESSGDLSCPCWLLAEVSFEIHISTLTLWPFHSLAVSFNVFTVQCMHLWNYHNEAPLCY